MNDEIPTLDEWVAAATETERWLIQVLGAYERSERDWPLELAMESVAPELRKALDVGRWATVEGPDGVVIHGLWTWEEAAIRSEVLVSVAPGAWLSSYAIAGP